MSTVQQYEQHGDIHPWLDLDCLSLQLFTWTWGINCYWNEYLADNIHNTVSSQISEKIQNMSTISQYKIHDCLDIMKKNQVQLSRLVRKSFILNYSTSFDTYKMCLWNRISPIQILFWFEIKKVKLESVNCHQIIFIIQCSEFRMCLFHIAV